MPAECLIIGSFSYGDEICYLRVDSQGQKTELALWDHELGKFVESWPSFAALLDDLMVIGGRAFNYDGTHRRFAMESLVSAIKNIFRRK